VGSGSGSTSAIAEAEGEIEPQEKRLGADNRTITTPTATFDAVDSGPEPDPFDEWFSEHVMPRCWSSTFNATHIEK